MAAAAAGSGGNGGAAASFRSADASPSHTCSPEARAEACCWPDICLSRTRRFRKEGEQAPAGPAQVRLGLLSSLGASKTGRECPLAKFGMRRCRRQRGAARAFRHLLFQGRTPAGQINQLRKAASLDWREERVV